MSFECCEMFIETNFCMFEYYHYCEDMSSCLKVKSLEQIKNLPYGHKKIKND